MPDTIDLFALAVIGVVAFGAGVAVAYGFFRRERRGFILELHSLWERLDAIFYRSPLAITLCEPQGEAGTLRAIDCNLQACELHGLSRDELIARPCHLADVAGEGSTPLTAWLRSSRPGELWRGETVAPRPDGLAVSVARVCAKMDIGGRQVVLVVERDVSEQRRAEEALRDSEQRFRRIVETADCLLWKAHVREADGKTTWKFEVPVSGLKQRLEAAAGLSFSAGLVWSRLKVPELAAMNERSRRALSEGWPSYRQEFRVPLPDGTVLWLQEKTEIERLGPGEWNLVGVAVDVSRLKEAESAMRVSEERNRLVLAASNDGIWDYDVGAVRMVCSERCLAMLGLSEAEAPASPQDWRTRIHPDDLAVEEAAWTKHRASGEPCVYQARFRHQDGSWRWFMVRANAVADSTGALRRVVGSHTDITELKRTDGELQESRRLRAIGELVGGIAHEFNNLLTPMLLQTTMMRDGHAPGDTLEEQLKPVIAAVTEARELTQRILAFGRRATMNTETLDWHLAVQDHLELLRHTIDRRVRLRLEPPPAPLWIRQNRTDIAQIVINLVLNARDTVLERAARGANEEGWVPAIDIEFATLRRTAPGATGLAEANEPATWHCLRIRDNGMGMTEEVKERIFEPFYTTKEVGHGTGLGLATVWHLTKTMAGFVEVESQPGRGSVFSVFLPAVEAPGKKPATPVPGPSRTAVAAPSRKARVLLADDQREVAATLGRILERWGHHVTTVTDGTAALELLAQRPGDFDLCITDLNMPGASGFEVIRGIRERGLGLKIVVIGGYMTAPVRQTLHGLDIDAMVAKPFTMDDIAAGLRACGW